MAEDDEYEEPVSASSPETTTFSDALEELKRRALASSLECQVEEVSDEEDSQPRLIGRVWLPCGKEKRKISHFREEPLRRFLATPFEDIGFLGRYDAIFDRKQRTIEARLRQAGPMSPASMLMHRLSAASRSEAPPERVYWPSEGGLTVSIGNVSESFLPYGEFLQTSATRPLIHTIIVSGIQSNRHDDALHLLEQLANSVFFGLDLTLGLSLQLVRRRPEQVRLRSRPTLREAHQLVFPKYEYDAAPMALYWYARGARGMPLLQYLAYYQVLEFYFPTYSTKETGRRVQALLKDPSFRPDRDADIARMLSAISSQSGGGYGSERDQLRATLSECLEPSALREFLSADEDRKSFFGSQQKGLTKIKLNLNGTSQGDLRNEVADLVYEIRCRIVHTKGAETFGDKLLLPLSPEADLLDQNIELVRFIAQKVIIAGSFPFRHTPLSHLTSE